MTQSVRAQLNVSVGLLVAVVCAPTAYAQQRQTQAPTQIKQPEWQQASVKTGKVRGTVHDESGRAVSGVMISALGTTTGMATSDKNGKFVLSLPSGDYLLRAHRDGYVSSFRDYVRVGASSLPEKDVLVTRQLVALASSRPVMVAGVSGGTVVQAADAVTDPDHPHDEPAWRMRHLKRPVLRDIGGAGGGGDRPQNFRPHTNGFFDWALTNSARLITAPDYTGQVNFITTSAVDPTLGWSQPEGPRSIAYVSLSAPVGSAGDWRVRGAMNAADLSSWVLLGEYAARRTRTHAFDVGMSYSTQTYADPTPLAFVADVVATTRAVGGIYGSDHWRVLKGFELDYGIRWDRYSYVAKGSNMVSPRAGARVQLGHRLSVVGEAAQRMQAPGSTEFMPPAEAGPWLPPERTFTSLSSSGRFRAERTRHIDLGLEQSFGGDRTVSVRRFHQGIDDQTATIFGLNTEGALWAAGHYSVASVGSAVIDGWTMRAAGSVSSRLSGSIEYSVGATDWTPSGSMRRAELVAPSVVRRDTSRLNDLLASVDVAVPGSETRLSFVCRMNSAFSRAGQATPGMGARFGVQVSQALPFQPLRGGRLEVLMSMTNLFRDMRQSGSLYDELLTISPPLRLLGGVQIRF